MPNTLNTNVCIIGAGPAGTIAALFLAKQGIECTLVDKEKFPRDKICGDALSGKVVEILNKLDPEIIRDFSMEECQLGSWGVTFVAPNLEKLRVPFKSDGLKKTLAPGFISKRIDFDNLLLEIAKQKKEINYLEGINIGDYRREGEAIIAVTKDGTLEIQTNIIIAADGAHSRFAKKIAGLEVKPEHHCYGLRAYYNGITELDEENFIELQFLKEVLPGYFWIFPLPNGSANVGVGMRSDVIKKKKINLKKKFEEIVNENPIISKRFKKAKMQDGVKLFSLPLASIKRSLSGDNFMLTGDAAALIDPFTGEGIGNAMVSGMLAAQQVETCLSTDNYSGEFLKSYDAKVYERLWSELRLSKKLQQLVKYPWLFNFVVKKAKRNKALSETISCMFEDLDIRVKLKQPSFYFNLIFSN